MNYFFEDVVIMGAALEQAFYEKLAEMPSDVRFDNKKNTNILLINFIKIGN